MGMKFTNYKMKTAGNFNFNCRCIIMYVKRVYDYFKIIKDTQNTLRRKSQLKMVRILNTAKQDKITILQPHLQTTNK